MLSHKHSCTKGAETTLRAYLLERRLIDYVTRKLVPLTEDKEYIALSYVWGSPDESASGVPQTSVIAVGDATVDSVPTPAPATIKGSITAVKLLRERYFWVDRYCITDDQNKHVQMKNMGSIYNQALATIVAVSARDYHSGLAGVSRPRRISQPYVRKREITLVTTQPHVSLDVSRSKWVTRG